MTAHQSSPRAERAYATGPRRRAAGTAAAVNGCWVSCRTYCWRRWPAQHRTPAACRPVGVVGTWRGGRHRARRARPPRRARKWAAPGSIGCRRGQQPEQVLLDRATAEANYRPRLLQQKRHLVQSHSWCRSDRRACPTPPLGAPVRRPGVGPVAAARPAPVRTRAPAHPRRRPRAEHADQQAVAWLLIEVAPWVVTGPASLPHRQTPRTPRGANTVAPAPRGVRRAGSEAEVVVGDIGAGGRRDGRAVRPSLPGEGAVRILDQVLELLPGVGSEQNGAGPGRVIRG